MVDLYGVELGQSLSLPLGGHLHRFTVVGVWRDYARQFGTVLLRPQDYVRLTGDHTRTEAALWLGHGVAAEPVIRALQARLPRTPRCSSRPRGTSEPQPPDI